MAVKKTPVQLADQLCTVVLELRTFGEINSPYLTRLENELRRKGWRVGRTRAEKIEEELTDRQTQLKALIIRLKAALTEFGRIAPYETDLLNKYWDEAMRIQTLFNDGVASVRGDVSIVAPPPSLPRGPGVL